MSHVLIVTPLTSRLTRWPAVPANVTVVFSLATVVVTVMGSAARHDAVELDAPAAGLLRRRLMNERAVTQQASTSDDELAP